MVEILDHWQDVGLTAGERNDLLVLAENANDNTRHTWGPVHASYILKRANKSAASWRITINRLMKKKALEYAQRDGKEQRGHTGRCAVYRIVELCPDAPHDGYQGHCTRPERVTSQMTQPEDGEGYPSANPVSETEEEGYLTANPEGYPSANPVDGEGYLTATEWVSQELTPTPLLPSLKDPSDTPSSSVAEVVELADARERKGGGGGDSFEGRATSFIDSLDYRGKAPSRSQRDKLTSLVASALAAGWSEKGLRVQLDLAGSSDIRNAAGVYEHRLNDLPEATAQAEESPEMPPACAACLEENPTAANNPRWRSRNGIPCPTCHPQMVHGDMWDRAMARAHGRMAATGTDSTVAGWMQLSSELSTTDQRVAQGQALAAKFRQLEQHQPHSNGDWDAFDAQASLGIRPDGSDRIPHCGDADCDPVSRTRETTDWQGYKTATPCSKCHPDMQF